MARPPSFFTNLLRRRSLLTIQNSNNQFRHIGSNGRSEDSHDKPQYLSEVVKEICATIRSKPRWENTLLSDFPGVSFLDSSFLNQLLLHQDNVFFLIRLLRWLNSTFGYSPEESTCSLIFDALVKDKAAEAAKVFLNFTHFVPEPACLESYVRCLCECRMMEDALQVLDEMKKMGVCSSLETWNCVLQGCIKEGCTVILWELYGEMIESGVVADIDTVDCLIQAFCMDKKVTNGYELFRQVLDDGYVPQKVAFDKLISGFVLDRKYDRVSAVLHIMIAKGVEPDLYTYQQIIHGLCMIEKQHEALRIFNDIKGRGYAPDRVMYTTMIRGLCKIEWLGAARKLWFEMIQKGIEPNEYTYNTLLSGYFGIGDIRNALHLYKEMQDTGYRDTLLIYNTMISGLSLNGRTRFAFQLFKQMTRKNVARDVITYNSMIRGFCKEDKIAEGMKLLHELVEQGLQPSGASYGFLMENLYCMKRIDEVKALWIDMQDKCVEPACIRNSIIIGLSEQRHVAAGIYWLEYLVKKRLMPRQRIFERLIEILSQRDKLDVALMGLGYMFKIGYIPSSQLKKSSLIGATTFETGLIA